MAMLKLADFVKFDCYDVNDEDNTRVLVRLTSKAGLWKVTIESDEGDEEYYVTTLVKDKILQAYAKGVKPYTEEILEETEDEVEV